MKFKMRDSLSEVRFLLELELEALRNLKEAPSQGQVKSIYKITLPEPRIFFCEVLGTRAAQV